MPHNAVKCLAQHIEDIERQPDGEGPAKTGGRMAMAARAMMVAMAMPPVMNMAMIMFMVMRMIMA